MPLYLPAPNASLVSGLPTGAIASTVPRWVCNNGSSVGTTGQLKVSLIWLEAGWLVSNIVIPAANTGGASLTHSLAGLYTPSQSAPALLATSNDDTTATWTANTSRTFAMTTPYLVPASGYFYIGSAVAGTTLPTFYVQNASQGTALAALPPITGGVSTGSGITTTLPNPGAAITVNASQFYAYVT